jgi:osmotically inducible protein OsmC
MQGPLTCQRSIRLILSRSRLASSRMHRKSPRTRIRHSSPVNTVVYVCNTKVSHPTQRPDAVFCPATRFHPAAGAGRSCSVLNRLFGNCDRLTFDTEELSVIRKARAVWYGTGRGGKGNLSSDSGVLADTPYSFSTRFEGEKGTNPEKLVAAAHAGCFTMALAFRLQAAGYTPTELHTEAAVNLEKSAEGFSINRSTLTPACERTESGSRHVRSVSAGRRAELPGFQGAQDRNHIRRAAGVLGRQS